jgi:small subunit ribosomal protein S15
MARMYSRRRGKSKSDPPLHSSWREWLGVSPGEIESTVLKLYDKGYSSSMVGTILRDQYGVPGVKTVTGSKITEILEKHGKAPKIPEDLKNLIVKATRLRRHLEMNPKDLHNKRALQLTEAKIRRLTRYYKRNHILSDEWHYRPEMAEMLIR